MQKTRRREENEFQAEFLRSLDRLQRYLDAYYQDDNDAWQDMVGKLSILLCDRTPIPLAEKIIPNLSLHPLILDITGIKENYQLYDAVRKSYTPTGIIFELFDLSRPKLPLEEWLQQTVLYISEETPKEILESIPWESDSYIGMIKNIPNTLKNRGTAITLYDLIWESRSQMGIGHFTPTVRSAMQTTESVLIRDKRKYISYHAKCIIAISEYVVLELNQQWLDFQLKTNS